LLFVCTLRLMRPTLPGFVPTEHGGIVSGGTGAPGYYLEILQALPRDLRGLPPHFQPLSLPQDKRKTGGSLNFSPACPIWTYIGVDGFAQRRREALESWFPNGGPALFPSRFCLGTQGLEAFDLLSAW
jgi:hypothetical protein